MKKTNNERNAGRKKLFIQPAKLIGVMVRIDKEKEMKAEIKAVQDKYKNL